MLYTIRQTVQLFTLGFVFLILASSSSKAWTFSEGEEDWGPTCFVKQQHDTGEITVLSAKGSFNPAMLVSLQKYPKKRLQIPVTFRWGNGTEFKVHANLDDYFGQVYIQLKRPYIDNLLSRKSLNIVVRGASPILVPMKGASQAFKQFINCTQDANLPSTTPSPTPAPAPVPIQAPPKAPSGQPVPDLVGEYVHNPIKSGWDTGSIIITNRQLRWINKVGASWNLYLDPANQNILTTRQDNPYYAKYPDARIYKIIRKNGQVTGFEFAHMTYTRKSSSKPVGAGDRPKPIPSAPRDTGQLGGMRLLPGYQHQPMQGHGYIVGRIIKKSGLEIGYEIGRVTEPAKVIIEGRFQDRPKMTPKDHIRWYREQVVNGQPMHIAYRKDKILFVSFPNKGMNFSAKISNGDEMAEMLLMIMTYPGSRLGQ